MTWRAITIFGYLLIIFAGVLLEVIARIRTRPARFGTVVKKTLHTRSGRIAIFATWAWLGLHFLG